jgi:hypothetical protein
MTWNAFHRRGDVLRAVVEAADQRLDGILPLDVPGARECFADDVDLVGALSLKWHARLSGNLERAFGTEPMDLESAVVRAWHTTAQQMPGVRHVLDRATEQPDSPEMSVAMGRARRAELVRLAQAAGLANDASDRASRAGARIEDQARVGLAPAAPAAAATPPPAVPEASEPAAAETPRSRDTGADKASFVERIKAVLAA